MEPCIARPLLPRPLLTRPSWGSGLLRATKPWLGCRMPIVALAQVYDCLSKCHQTELRGARFVYLLSMLCSLNSTPLPKCQNLVRCPMPGGTA